MLLVRLLCVWVVLAAVTSGWEARGQGKDAPSSASINAAPTNTAPANTAPTGKGKKAAYTGPTEIVVLQPTPMLDEEGRQRLDPDGKPMFNAPVKQQRDKHGHPLFDEQGKPVMQTPQELGYDERGKRIKAKKERPPKMTPVAISRGTFTVDGVIGKAALNYDIPDLKYIYLYVPGIGVAVVSHTAFAGAQEQRNGFNGKSLMVTVGEHTLEIASDKALLGKKEKPSSAFVRVDREFALPTQYPAVGYGQLLARPYGWPGSKANSTLGGPVQPPPLPVNLRPALLLQPCPAGQMRTAGAAPLPGEATTESPCAPIKLGGTQTAGAPLQATGTQATGTQATGTQATGTQATGTQPTGTPTPSAPK
jgi:hypothetical protein